MDAEAPPWVVDADAAARLAGLESELASLYEGLGSRAPDSETAQVLERLASAARSRAQVFLQASASVVGSSETAFQAWVDALCRFEAAAADAAGQGDLGLDAFHEEVVRLGRFVDVLLLVAGRDLDG